MWQNGTIKSYIYLCLSEGKRQTYIRPLWSSQLLPTLLLCPRSPFIPFNSDTRDLPPRKRSELNALACVMRGRWINRHMGIAAGRKGCREKSHSWYFCTETVPQTSLKPAPLRCTINLPPKAASGTAANGAEGVSATRSPLRTLKIP